MKQQERDGIIKTEARQAIPLNAISRKGQGACILGSKNTCTLVIGEPVVHDKSIPAVNIQAVALIKSEHTVAH